MSAAIPKTSLICLNNLFEMEKKLKANGDPSRLLRNIERVKEAFAEEQLFFEDPTGQDFRITRADLEANIAGPDGDDLVVKDVIKPIIRWGREEFSMVIQKGIVIVESASRRNIDEND